MLNGQKDKAYAELEQKTREMFEIKKAHQKEVASLPTDADGCRLVN